MIYTGTEKESKDLNATGKKSEAQRKKEQQLEALQQSANRAGQHRSLTAVSSRRSRDQSTCDDDDSPSTEYQANFRRVVLAALLRSVDVAQKRRSSTRFAGEQWLSRMDRKTAACLSDGAGVFSLATSIEDRLQRAVRADVESEGGHRAVVLQGAEGAGRTTTLRRFVELVAASCPDLPPPVVVARRVSWPGCTALDLLYDIVTQLNAVVNVTNIPIDVDAGVPAFAGPQRVDLDSLVKSYSNLLRAFSEFCPGRLVVAVDGVENVRCGSTISGGDMSWLAVPVPAGVHVVATYLTSSEPDSQSSITTVVGGRTVRTIDVAELSESAVNQVVANAFRRRSRQPPVDGELTVVMQLVGTKPLAAYVTLLADEFAARSAAMFKQPEKPFEQLTNMEKIAKERFKRAERLYGKSVVCTVVT